MSLSAYSDLLDLVPRRASLEYARRLAPNNGMVLAKLGFLWYEVGNYEQALENCGSALKQFPKLGYLKGLATALPTLDPKVKSNINEMASASDEFAAMVRQVYLDCLRKLDA